MSRPLLLILLCMTAGVIQNWASIHRWLNPPPPRPPGAEKVVLYATRWCGYCAKTRAFFAQNGIDYLELDVEESDEGKRGYRALGGNGVPIVVIDDSQVIHGYNPAAIGAALEGSH